MKIGIITFPGSNCDRDCRHVVKTVLGYQAHLIWHQETSLSHVDVVILPGGFSYGDYLRAGAIARFSPIMESIRQFAEKGGIVLGICNGFQILLEAGLLPGAMLKNRYLSFICQDVSIKVENAETTFTNEYASDQVLTMPIAHAEGNYYADPMTLSALHDHAQIVFRYCDQHGDVTAEANPNGSLENIAGIRNKAGNVLGMMPHPERCAEDVFGKTDGVALFRSLRHALNQMVA
ncbi:MAG: phosphoribosylformylglycinamidine synthase subunit PurQ [Nitrospirales bacterium]|nr:MAG: phosphoribosylformylglycinamidine synthase subunit PurQ [Nitrospirales bacterium]